jgi:hypothetical protein
MSKYYRRVEIDTEGNSAEPVNFVGVHPFRWNSDRTIQGNTPPDAGFVEAEAYEKEFVEWLYSPFEFEETYQAFRMNKNMTLDELYEYWQREVKQ